MFEVENQTYVRGLNTLKYFQNKRNICDLIVCVWSLFVVVLIVDERNIVVVVRMLWDGNDMDYKKLFVISSKSNAEKRKKAILEYAIIVTKYY